MSCDTKLILDKDKFRKCLPSKSSFSIHKEGLYLDGVQYAKTVFTDGVFTEMQKRNGERIAIYLGRVYYKNN